MADIGSDRFQAARLILTLRRAGVTNSSILSAMEDIPRDHFVSGEAKSLAYDNAALPIDCGQTNLRPSLTGHLLQLADLEKNTERVLLVGAGSGYMVAVLSRLASSVFAIERQKHLFEQAQQSVGALGISNVQWAHGDGLSGWPDQVRFDRIVLTGLSEAAPVALLSQLTREGWLIQPVSTESGQLISVYGVAGKLLNSMEVMGFQPLLNGIIGE